MKKKIMAVTLCLAMASTFVVGCGQKKETDSGKSEEKSSGKVEIEFVQVKREAAESYTKVIEAFQKKNPDIVIKQNVVPDAQEVLMTRASSDNLPDLMNHWPTDAQFVQFEDEGLLLDLSEKGLNELCDWLAKYNCTDVCMESTGKYWIPVFNILEQHNLWVTLSHPKYTKPMKGNKTDRKDAKWICDLYMCGMVKPSFIPPADIRELRDLVRYRFKLTCMITGEKNRAQNCLQYLI